MAPSCAVCWHAFSRIRCRDSIPRTCPAIGSPNSVLFATGWWGSSSAASDHFVLVASSGIACVKRIQQLSKTAKQQNSPQHQHRPGRAMSRTALQPHNSCQIVVWLWSRALEYGQSRALSCSGHTASAMDKLIPPARCTYDIYREFLQHARPRAVAREKPRRQKLRRRVGF